MTRKPRPISSEFLCQSILPAFAICRCFSELADAELVHLAAYAEFKTTDPGDVLIHEGASGYTFFVILEGTVAVDQNGEQIETLGPGDFFGEMAVLGSGRRNATITASSHVELLALFGTVFRTMESDHPHVAELIRQRVAERARH